MTPSAARAMYRRQVAAHGETVMLGRVVANGDDIAKAARARVTGYKPEQLVGDIQQGDRKVIVLAEDVEATGFPVPFKTGGNDTVMIRDHLCAIVAVDDSTRRVAGTLIAYEITVRG